MSKITICEGNIILSSKKDTIIHAFDGNITTNAQQKNIWTGEKGTVIGDYEAMELPTMTAEVIEVGFAKQEIKDSTIDNTKKVMSLPIKGSFAMGEKVFLKVKTLGLIGEKIKVEVRQAVEKQLAEKDQKVEVLSVAEMTVGKITQSEDAKDKYETSNLKALENIALKEMVLEPQTEDEKKSWKDILSISKDKKIKLYFHVEVLDAESEVIYKGDDISDSKNFSTKTPFELTEGGNKCSSDFTYEQLDKIWTEGKTWVKKPDEKGIANIAYADKNRQIGYKLGNIYEGDGWKFRGRGLMQTTGRFNYNDIQKKINEYLPNSGIDLSLGKDFFTAKEAVFAGLGDWVFRGADKLADKGNTPKHVNAITAKINISTKSYKERRDAFLITKEIFK